MIGISLAILRRFWAVAARRNSSWAAGASQSQPIESEDAFEVGEQHLDLLPLAARYDVSVRLGDVPRSVASGFIDGARYFARGGIGTATGFQIAGIAGVLAGAIDQCRIIVHQRARRRHRLPTGADIGVCLLVVIELVA